jgi:hypothetical protein
MGRSVLFMQTVSRSLTGSFRASFEWELARTPPLGFRRFSECRLG